MPFPSFFFLSTAIFILLLSSSNAFAQNRAYDSFITTGGIEVLTGPGYQPVTVNQARGQAVWNGVFDTGDGGLPRSVGTHFPRNASGNAVAVTAVARVPSTEVAKAVGRTAARLALKVALPVQIGVELFDLGSEIGHIVSRAPSGELAFQKTDASICTVAPCFEYSVTGGPRASSRPAACSAMVGRTHNGHPVATATIGPSGSIYCAMYRAAGTLIEEVFIAPHSVAPSPSAVVPTTLQEFVDAVAAKSGWPSSSNINRLLKADVDAGNKLATGPITVTGPSSTTGTSSQSVKPNGNTVTTTTTHNHTYQGNKLTTTNTTVVTNYSPTTNITETETTTETPGPDEPEPDNAVTDTPLPELPKLYEPKYPEGPSKVWTDRKADFMSSPLLALVNMLTPNIPAAGCPQFSIALDLSVINFGTYNTGPPCYVWDFCSVVILVTALFLSRRLIFGG